MDLKGTEGNDHLVGGADDDTLTGLGGNDTLEGLGGHDELTGGTGNDLLLAGDSYDHLTGGLGDDTLDGGADSDSVFYSNATAGVSVNLATGRASGAEGNDQLVNIENVYGSDFADVLVGDAGSNMLYGGRGNDTLDGGAGEDSAPYWGSSGPVNINLATGRVTGVDGNDQLSNIEDVDGSSFDDVIIGDSHDNRLYGSQGNDTLSGGGGADTFVFTSGPGAGVDRITDLSNGNVLAFDAGPLADALISGDDASKLAQGQVMVGTPTNGLTRLYVGTDSTPGADIVVELTGSFTAGQFSTEFAPYGSLLFDSTLAQPRNLTGTAGNDTLRGGNRDDTLNGLAGEDDLRGGDGNDTLDGGSGYDALYGGYGNDLLRGGDESDGLAGGAGNDTLDGGVGGDTVFYSSATGGVNVNLATGTASGADGNDQLSNIESIYGSSFNDQLTGDAGDNSLNGRAGNDTLVGGAGHDTAVYWDANGPVNVNLATGLASGADGNDQLSGIEEVTGSNYNDVLVGDANANVLGGNGGQDTLTGGAGADLFLFYGDNPLDIQRITDLGSGDVLAFGGMELSTTLLTGNNAAALLRGQVMLGIPTGGITRLYVGVNDQPGADCVIDLVGSFVAADFARRPEATGSLLFDTSLGQPHNLTGTAGNDTLRGGNQNDTLSGLGGDDMLDGGDGNDTLDGGDGYDTLLGGGGSDVLRGGADGDYLNGGSGDDTLDGGEGSDWALYGDASGGVTVNLATGQASGAAGSDRLSNFESLQGSAFDDVLTGDAKDNTMEGGAGNDTLVGGAGVDTVAYWGADASVTANLVTGKVSGGAGNDSLSGIENLVGSNHADQLTGDASANRLEGGQGADTLSGGAGADVYVLGADSPTEIDRILDLTNGDMLQFGVGELSFVILSGNDPSALLAGQLMLGTPSGGVTRLYVGADAVPGADVVVDLVGSFGVDEFTSERTSDDVPYGGILYDATLSVPRNLTGTAGDDTLRGGNRDDTLNGGAGSDYLLGSNGNDLLRGGEGYDNLSGGRGDDTMDGGADSDWVYYTNAQGAVVVNLATGKASGAEGNDTLANIENVYGSSFNDVLTGDAGDNTLNGRTGNDTLDGGVGHDQAVYWDAQGGVNVNLATGRASGADGNDVLISIEDVYGSYVDDVLIGDGGDNHIGGNSGNDQIQGGAGTDQLEGQDGNDSLDGGDGDDDLYGGAGNDTLVGGAGFDTAFFDGPQSNYVITALGPGAWRVEDKVGADGVDVLSGVENLSFVIPGTLDGSTLQGGSGYDIASYQTATSAVTVDLGAGTATGVKGSDTLKSIEGAIGSATFGDTLLGNAGDNQLSGLGGNDKLDGGDGDDKLDGGLGADVLTGGAGADVFIVDDAGDQVVEIANVPGAGTNGQAQEQGLGVGGSVDKVIASINYTLTNFVENLELAVAAGNLSGSGNALNNVLNGNTGNNRLTGGGGNDTLDGKEGTDTAVYAGARTGYQLLRTSSGVTVGATGSDEGTDSLSNIERLKFSDQGLALDMGAFQAGGTAALLMGATLGSGFTASRPWAGIFLNFFDGGASMLDGASLLVGAGIMAAFAGGADNATFVKFVYANVNGQAPDAATLASLVAPLNNNSTTQAQWMVDMAISSANQQHVGLAGLAQTGWAYDTA